MSKQKTITALEILETLTDKEFNEVVDKYNDRKKKKCQSRLNDIPIGILRKLVAIDMTEESLKNIAKFKTQIKLTFNVEGFIKDEWESTVAEITSIKAVKSETSKLGEYLISKDNIADCIYDDIANYGVKGIRIDPNLNKAIQSFESHREKFYSMLEAVCSEYEVGEDDLMNFAYESIKNIEKKKAKKTKKR